MTDTTKLRKLFPQSVCDNCVNNECLWRAPTGGNDPPVMSCPDKIDKPKTNADRIRAMTDEELADELLTAFAAFYDVEWSKEAVLDWLQKEAEEGE